MQQAQHVGDCRSIVCSGKIERCDNTTGRGLPQGDATNGKANRLTGLKLKRAVGTGQPTMGGGGIGNAHHLTVQKNTRLAGGHLQAKSIGNHTAMAIIGGYFYIDHTRITGTGRTTKGAGR